MRRSAFLPVLRQVSFFLVASALSPAFSAIMPRTASAMSLLGRAPAKHPEQFSRDAVAAGASSDWWSQVHADLERREYIGSATADGWHAPNPRQNLRTQFRNDGLEIVPRTASPEPWRWRWETVAWGREGFTRGVNAVAPVADGERIEYRRVGLVEWYENRKEGLEQGFTVSARPQGAGPLRIEGRVLAELQALTSADRQAVEFLDAQGVCVLRYGKLIVTDVHGRRLDAHLDVADGLLAIVIDDRVASYPLTVDPLLTTPAWTAESDQASALFGVSVATAGDVNGDGYSDVIVGAHLYDNGQTDEGRAYVYLGSASGLAPTPAWSAEGDQAGAAFGASVAAAGDVNGDGYSDVIVGAFFHDNGQTDEGRAHVYLGSASGLAASAAWTAESDQASAGFGVSVATAGDVNGDGYSDVIVGAHKYDDGEIDEGRAYVYLGSASGLAASAAWTAASDQASASFGISVATAGDVDGDGYSDVIVGAHGYDGGSVDEGRANVYLGSALGLATTAAWTAEPDADGIFFGFSVATAGDVNGDGYADVIVGAGDGARWYVHMGSASGLAAIAAWTGSSGQAGFGASVGTAGDVNGDGYADVIVSASFYDNALNDQGHAYVYFGSALGLFAPAAWTTEGDQLDANFGFSVATAGDVNGDGFSDVIVGAHMYDNGQADEGRAYVYLGSASGLAVNAVWTKEGGQAGALFGASVATAGDVNGDGYSDVIVGAYLYDGGQTDEGRAYVYLGSASGLAAGPAWTDPGVQGGAGFGYSVASAGDVNGDGYSDIIIGAYLHDGGQTDEGRAYVFLGSASGIAGTPWIAESDQAGALFGFSVATAGDVNGDGYSDVIVGADGYDNGQTDEGRAYVFLGSASGLGSTAAWTAEGDQADAAFGRVVATAGDVNGDGYSDIIVGADTYDNGQTDEGRAYVFLGSASGLASSPAWTAESDQASTRFGISVATAGDVNGDGYSDVIVGAPNFDSGQTDEGRAYVYLGSASGLAATAAWVTESDLEGGALGWSVATAGDVNGDGYSDVIVGAVGYDNGQLDEGRALVVLGSPSGLAANADWGAESNQVNALLGVWVATAGDVDGDGYSDVIVGAHHYDVGLNNEGRVFVYHGNGGDEVGLDHEGRVSVYQGNGGEVFGRAPRQLQADFSAPISLLGKTTTNSFGLRALGRSPAGRGRVRMEWEVKPMGTPFGATGHNLGPALPTGTPVVGIGSAANLSALADGLLLGTTYRWRLRILTDSPFFPRSRWLSLPYNSPTEADLRTLDATTAVLEPSDAGGGLRVEMIHPNPFHSQAVILYTLPQEGRVQISIRDLQGRRVASLVDGVETAGPHAIAWDGRDQHRKQVRPGIYWVSIRSGGETLSRKLVRN